MISLLSSSLVGIARGENSAGTAAAAVAGFSQPAVGDPDIATDFVTLSQASSQVAVSSKLAKVAQENDRALLDIIA